MDAADRTQSKLEQQLNRIQIQIQTATQEQADIFAEIQEDIQGFQLRLDGFGVELLTLDETEGEQVSEDDISRLQGDLRQIMEDISQTERQIRQGLASRPEQLQDFVEGVETQLDDLDAKLLRLVDQQGEPNFADNVFELQDDFRVMRENIAQIPRQIRQAMTGRLSGRAEQAEVQPQINEQEHEVEDQQPQTQRHQGN